MPRVTMSPIATPVKKLRVSKESGGTVYKFRPRKSVFGVCVHTTGRGPYDHIPKRGKDVTESALWFYAQSWMSVAHYVINSNGVIYQVVDEALVAPHCGIDAWQRQTMIDGSWLQPVLSTTAIAMFKKLKENENKPVPRPPSPKGVELWKARWPGFASPLKLYPTTSANDAYVGIEMIPKREPDKYNGQNFEQAQYRALNELLRDIQSRHEIELKGSRLVGHEDVDPYDRWDRTGGWDPGSLRPDPHFNWGFIAL